MFLEFCNLLHSLAQALRWFPISEPIFSAWISNHSRTEALSWSHVQTLQLHPPWARPDPSPVRVSRHPVSHPCRTKYPGSSLLFTLYQIFWNLTIFFLFFVSHMEPMVTSSDNKNARDRAKLMALWNPFIFCKVRVIISTQRVLTLLNEFLYAFPSMYLRLMDISSEK